MTFSCHYFFEYVFSLHLSCQNLQYSVDLVKFLISDWKEKKSFGMQVWFSHILEYLMEISQRGAETNNLRDSNQNYLKKPQETSLVEKYTCILG